MYRDLALEFKNILPGYNFSRDIFYVHNPDDKLLIIIIMTLTFIKDIQGIHIFLY